MTEVNAGADISSCYSQIQLISSSSFVFCSVCHPGITRFVIAIQNSPCCCVYMHTKQVLFNCLSSPSHGCCDQLLVFAIISDLGYFSYLLSHGWTLHYQFVTSASVAFSSICLSVCAESNWEPHQTSFRAINNKIFDIFANQINLTA